MKKIRATRVVEPKKDNFDIEKMFGEVLHKTVQSNTESTKSLVNEFERMSSDAGVKKLEEKFHKYIKNLKIEKQEIKDEINANVKNWATKVGDWVHSHKHAEYLTATDKREVVKYTTELFNASKKLFEDQLKPISQQLEEKSHKNHTHNEFNVLDTELTKLKKISDNLSKNLLDKANKDHKHKIRDIEGLSDKLKGKAKKDHKHDEYATKEEIQFLAFRRGGGGGSHVIQDEGTTIAQRGNLNFVGVGVTVTDDPNTNATIVTIPGVGSASAFIDLTDVPLSYLGGAGKFVKVNATEDGLEFVAGAGVTAAWGDITGTLADQLDLQAALDAKANSLGVDDNYVTDAEKVKLSNLSGTNTGDQTSIVGISGTKAQYNTSLSDGDFLFVGDITQYTDELAQDAVGGMIANSTFVSLAYVDGTPTLTASLSATGTPSGTTYLRGDNTWATIAGGGDVTAAANIGDHRLVRGDGGAKGIQASGITISDTDGVTGITDLVVDGNITAIGGLYTEQVGGNYVYIEPRGAGTYPVFDMYGADANVGLNFRPQGTGRIQMSGVNMPTISSTDILTNKSIDLASNTVTMTLAQLNTAISDGNIPSNLTDFVSQTNWRMFYSNGSGDVTEFALGDSGKVLQSNGAAAAPTWETVSGGSGITRTVVVTSGSITLGSTASVDYIYFVAGAHTMSLPAPNTNRYTVKNNHSANITIDTAGAELIEGAVSISVLPEHSVDIASDGTNWFII